jgi:hypothetical protein
MKSTRQRVQWRTPLSSRLPKIKRNALQRVASWFPRWLPLTLLWRPAGRARRSLARGEALPKFNSFATHVHAQVNSLASTVLQQTLVAGRTTAESFYRSMERFTTLQLKRREPVDRVTAAPPVQRSHESGAPSSRVIEVPANASRQDLDSSRRRIALDLPVSGRAGGGRELRSRVPRRPELTMTASPVQAVPSIVRGFSPVALTGRPRRDEAQSSSPEARAKMNPVEFFGSAPELVWRQASAPKTTDSGTVSQAARAAGDEPSAPAAAAQTTAVHSVPEAGVVRRPMRFSDLEPSFVDRLADDVIRRVERRSRIERERRGL